MTVDQLLGSLAQNEVMLFLDGDRLRYRAPEGSLTPDMRAAIGEHRPVHRVSFRKPAGSPESPCNSSRLEATVTRLEGPTVGPKDDVENGSMANLYKKPIRITDPRTGQKVTAKSKKWWGRYRDALGIERRVPLARDKVAAQAMLSELVLKAERQATGQADPFEDHAKTPLKEHIDAFEQHLRHKGNTAQHVCEVATKVRRIATGCKWAYIRDLSASRVQTFLAELRQGKGDEEGLSIQTSNHYLRAIKQFSRWLLRDRRANDDRLVHLAMLNVKVDRRHDRRALSADEFARLAEAAASGPTVVRIPGKIGL